MMQMNKNKSLLVLNKNQQLINGVNNMNKISFKIKFDDEFKDYYIQPFKDCDDYVWINDIMESNKGLVMITEFGYYPVEKIDWKSKDTVSNGPDTIFEQKYNVNDGQLSITIPETNNNSGYRVYITKGE